jgi:membrane peptidoglycan carboxypeptidase
LNVSIWFQQQVLDRRRRIAVIAAVVAACLLALLVGSVAWAAATLPDPTRLDLNGQSIRIVDRRGDLIEERNSEGARVTPVKLDQISPAVKQATIAIEDRHFYAHRGVDWGRVVKAFFVDVVARRPQQGASTITQQLAKVSVLRTPQKTPLRKLRELILATQLESRYSKDQLLELYMNSIPYGHRATGIEAAAQVYFSKPAKDLTLAEGSFLAGLPRGPSYYDPKLHGQRARERQRTVLSAMTRDHMITQAQADEAARAELRFTYSEQRISRAPHFVDYVIEQLEDRFGPQTIARGGLVVKTTLDLKLQAGGQRAVGVGMQALQKRNADNGDLLALDPRTGEVLAMVGSADFFNDAINGQFNVVTALRQPGSSFKPYVYEEAFRQRKLTLGSKLDDTARNFAGGQFRDFDNRDMGEITAHQALLLSRNIPALRTMQLAGYDNVNALAREFGITSKLKSEVATALGSSEVRLLDHAVGYGVFASGGMRHSAVTIREVTDRSGHSLFSLNTEQGAKRVVSPAEAYLITYVLKDYSPQWNLGWNRPFAGKSGTTNDFKDAWMMAYSPNIVVGAWVGHTGKGDQNMKEVFGTDVGRTVLKDFINSGLREANVPVVDFQRPAGLFSGSLCADPDPKVPPPASELFLPGTEGRNCPSPSPSPTPSESASPSPSPSASASASTSPTPSASTSPSPTPAPRPSPSPTPTPPP